MFWSFKFFHPYFQLSQRGILDPVAAQLFLNISEKARQAVEIYFDLDTELYFAYTHLVCRTALPGLLFSLYLILLCIVIYFYMCNSFIYYLILKLFLNSFEIFEVHMFFIN